jgi:hypothetical protein
MKCSIASFVLGSATLAETKILGAAMTAAASNVATRILGCMAILQKEFKIAVQVKVFSRFGAIN